MTTNGYSTPILLIIFNRPDKLRLIMGVLSDIKPKKLYISADGPRKNEPADIQLCRMAREVATMVDWDCEVHTNFAKDNLGLGGNNGVESAFSWFFSKEEEGIILEDDQLPSLDFFPYAENLLNKYRYNKKITLICGTNFFETKIDIEDSYYFSIYQSWGWATWKRVWNNYDRDMAGFDKFIDTNKIDGILEKSNQKKYWLKFFTQLKNGRFNFFDTKWLFSMWANQGLCIIPKVNLIQNIGFDEKSTHTSERDKDLSIPVNSLGEIFHPEYIHQNKEADNLFFDKIYDRGLLRKIVIKLNSILKIRL